MIRAGGNSSSADGAHEAPTSVTDGLASRPAAGATWSSRPSSARPSSGETIAPGTAIADQTMGAQAARLHVARFGRTTAGRPVTRRRELKVVRGQALDMRLQAMRAWMPAETGLLSPGPADLMIACCASDFLSDGQPASSGPGWAEVTGTCFWIVTCVGPCIRWLRVGSPLRRSRSSICLAGAGSPTGARILSIVLKVWSDVTIREAGPGRTPARFLMRRS